MLIICIYSSYVWLFGSVYVVWVDDTIIANWSKKVRGECALFESYTMKHGAGSEQVGFRSSCVFARHKGKQQPLLFQRSTLDACIVYCDAVWYNARRALSRVATNLSRPNGLLAIFDQKCFCTHTHHRTVEITMLLTKRAAAVVARSMQVWSQKYFDSLPRVQKVSHGICIVITNFLFLYVYAQIGAARTAMTKACVLEQVHDMRMRDVDINEPFTER